MFGIIRKIGIAVLRLVAPPLLLLAVWEALCQSGRFPDAVLVPPEQVYLTFIGLLQDGELWDNLRVSGSRVLLGFAIGGGAGLVTGIAFGLSPTLERYLGLSFTVLRQVPFIAWGPLLILVMGIGEGFKIAIIANAAFFPMALNTLDGVRNVPRSYRDVAAIFQFSRWSLIRRLIVPAALPFILTGLRLALSRSWMMVVGAELFASTVGVGHMMDWAREMFQIDVVMVGVLLTGVVGFGLDQTLRLIETRFSTWKPRAA